MENPYGTLKRIDTAEELTSHFDSNNGLIKRNFALVIPYELLTTTILSEIESNGGVGGILVINSNLTSSTLTSYSPDSKFPNQDASLYNNDASQHAWNPTGDDLRLQSFTFPITVLTKGSQSYNEILEALEFNNAGNYDPPVYAMQWDAEMFAAVDSRTCLRRARCKPIGDSSVWASFS
jgi:nicastrin